MSVKQAKMKLMIFWESFMEDFWLWKLRWKVKLVREELGNAISDDKLDSRRIGEEWLFVISALVSSPHTTTQSCPNASRLAQVWWGVWTERFYEEAARCH